MAAKAALRVAEMCDFTRMTDVGIVGKVDNDALRQAVNRGSSTKMAHLRKTAAVNFDFLKSPPIKIERVDTTQSAG